MGIFDGLPVPPEKEYLREELSRIDESWAAARFDSLPHVVHILTSKDRDGDAQILKEQSDVVEDVVDEVVQSYHTGFNKAIQNYSQILRFFSESTGKIDGLKIDLTESKRRLSVRNKQMNQLSYRSVTLRHIISLLDQLESIAKVPSQIEKLIAEKQFYAAVQVHVQSSLMLEREGLQMVGALQDVRSELTKLRGTLFYKVLEDLHAHLYNKGEFSSLASNERDDQIPTTTAGVYIPTSLQPLSRRTKTFKGDRPIDESNRTNSIVRGSSIDVHDEVMSTDGNTDKIDGVDGKVTSRQLPQWLLNSSPDEFVEAITKSEAPLHVKYLQTMVQCLCTLGKVAAAGAILCQRLRPTVHEIVTSKIKSHVEVISSSRSNVSRVDQISASGLHHMKGQVESYHQSNQNRQNGLSSLATTLLAASPVSPMMAPNGKAQSAAKELLDSILDTVVRIFENHVVVAGLLESKSAQHNINTPKSIPNEINWNLDSESSQATGGYSIGLSLTVLQSECQQLICEILRATPEAASADGAAQTARLAKKGSKENKGVASEDSFEFRFTEVSLSIPNQGVDLIRQGWNKKGSNASQEGYGSAAVLPEQGMYLAASLYRPVLQFTDKLASMLQRNYSQLGNDGLLAFLENFVKDHFLPTMFVDYRKGVQQAISSPAAFRPRAQVASSYVSSIEKGRPVLQGLLAIEYLAKEVFAWAQAMPKFAVDLVKYVQMFLERTYERCRTSYMEAVLEKQSYMVIGRHDIEKLMRQDPASACLPTPHSQSEKRRNIYDTQTVDIESELTELLLNLRPIKKENLIHDDNKLILLASLSDSLEYVADSIERLGQTILRAAKAEHYNGKDQTRDLSSFASEYRKLAIDCLKVLRVEMQLETLFHMQEMSTREYLDDQDAEEPDDFIISITTKITRRDEELAPFLAGVKRNYIFGGISNIAAYASIKALADMKSINLFGVHQISRNSIALEQALAAIPSIDAEAVQQRLERVRTYFELLNMPFEGLLAFIAENQQYYTPAEYANLLRVKVPGRDIPPDAQSRLAEVLSH